MPLLPHAALLATFALNLQTSYDNEGGSLDVDVGVVHNDSVSTLFSTALLVGLLS